MTKTKATYTAIAKKLNKMLDSNGSITVLDTRNHGKYYGKYSLYLDDMAYDMATVKGDFQNALYGDTLTVGDNKYYLEPVTSWLFDVVEL